MAHTHFINGKWKGGSEAAFVSRNPASFEIVWEGKAAAKEEVDEAVVAAREATEHWSFIPLQQRIEYLERFGKELAASTPVIAEMISKEVGKPLWESKNEVQAMINKIAISIDAYHKRCPETTQETPSGTLVTRHKPHGVMAILGPFNFPGHLPNGHIIPALLAGNTIVFKPSEMAPGSAEKIIECWGKCDLPSGVINLVQGGKDTGFLVANHSGIDGLCFTGSYETGIILAETFAKHPEKILALEMGGNNPLVVAEVSNIEDAVDITIKSAYLTSGQRCSCARRLIVLKGEHGDKFVEELIKAIKNITVGPYTDTPEPFMGPVISEKAASYLLAQQKAFQDEGGIALCEMQLKKMYTALITPGLMDVTSLAKVPDQEIFGPFLQLIRVTDFNAAIEEANKTAYGLTAGLLSKNESEFREFYRKVRAGVINWNTPLTGASSTAPFGGVGHSGNCRPSGFYAADYCAYPVASLESRR